MEKGVFLYGEKTNPAVIENQNNSAKIIKVTIAEGKKRHIRITFGLFSYKVKKLKRIAFGPLKLKNLYSGSYRMLKDFEVQKLRKALSQ